MDKSPVYEFYQGNTLNAKEVIDLIAIWSMKTEKSRSGKSAMVNYEFPSVFVQGGTKVVGRPASSALSAATAPFGGDASKGGRGGEELAACFLFCSSYCATPVWLSKADWAQEELRPLPNLKSAASS